MTEEEEEPEQSKVRWLKLELVTMTLKAAMKLWVVLDRDTDRYHSVKHGITPTLDLASFFDSEKSAREYLRHDCNVKTAARAVVLNLFSHVEERIKGKAYGE